MLKDYNKSFDSVYNCKPLFTMLRDKKYYISVFVPIFSQSFFKISINLNRKLHRCLIYINIESRISIRRYQIKMTLLQILN